MFGSLAVACTGAPPETGDTASTVVCDARAARDDGVFSVVAEGVPGGVLLGATSVGDDALLVGGELGGDARGLIAHYDGTRLCTEPPVAHTLWWVAGAGDERWMVGAQGVAIHEVDGVVPSRERDDVPTTATLFGVAMTSDGVWAVGGDVSAHTGEVWVWRSGEWSAVALDLPHVLFKVWDRWIVGDGVSYHIGDDDSLTEVPTAAHLLTVRGGDDGQVWAVGGRVGPTVMRGDLGGWTEEATDTLTQPLNGVWTAPGEDVWVAGNFGTTARRHPDGAWEVASPPLTVEHLHAVWPHCGEVLFVGGTLFSSTAWTGTVLRYGAPRDPVPVVACPDPAGPTARR